MRKDLASVFVGMAVIMCMLFGSTWVQQTILTDKIISTCKESK